MGAALAAVVFELVRGSRLRDSLDRARTEAVFDLRLADGLVPDSTDLQQAVESHEDRGIHAMLFVGGRSYRSDAASTSGSRPACVTGRSRADRIRPDRGRWRPHVDRRRAPRPDRGAELYFAFSETGSTTISAARHDARIGWAAIVVDRVRARAGRGEPDRHARRGRGLGETLHLRRLARAPDTGRRARVGGRGPGGAPRPGYRPKRAEPPSSSSATSRACAVSSRT